MTKVTKKRIKDNEIECEHCGYLISIGDTAFEKNDKLYCSINCSNHKGEQTDVVSSFERIPKKQNFRED